MSPCQPTSTDLAGSVLPQALSTLLGGPVAISKLEDWGGGALLMSRRCSPTLEKKGARALAASSFLLNLPLIPGAL